MTGSPSLSTYTDGRVFFRLGRGQTGVCCSSAWDRAFGFGSLVTADRTLLGVWGGSGRSLRQLGIWGLSSSPHSHRDRSDRFTEIPMTMKIEARLTYDKVRFDQEFDAHLVVSVTAPTVAVIRG